jgi:hypothetical protein
MQFRIQLRVHLSSARTIDALACERLPFPNLFSVVAFVSGQLGRRRSRR